VENFSHLLHSIPTCMLEQEESTGELSSSDSDEDYDREARRGILRVRNPTEDKVVEKSPKGRFIRFNRRLGSGAFKTVYLAFDNDTGREVAWNVVSVDRLTRHERRRLDEEIKTVSAMDNPRIIKFVSAWINKDKGEVIFITERITGGSLRSYINRLDVPLKLKVIRNWCRQILEGLVYLHSFKPQPLIHRDLKCDNIFVDSHDGSLIIGDLGLCTTFSATTMHRSLVGTPECMAPEIYEEHYGIEVDIYAFGMCLLEMISHRPPFSECAGPGQIYKRVISGYKPADVDRIKNPALKSIVLRCLESDPVKRPTAVQLLADPFWTSPNNANELVDLNPTKSVVTPTTFLSNIDEALISLSSDHSQSSSQLHSIERKQSISVGDGGSSTASVVRDISPPQELDVNAVLRSRRIEQLNNVQLVVGSKRISFDYMVDTDTPKSIAQQILDEGLASDLNSLITIISQELLKRTQ
jgi:serine/threonine protein kinase